MSKDTASISLDDQKVLEELKNSLKEALLQAKQSLDSSKQAMVDSLVKEVDELKLNKLGGVKVSRAYFTNLKKSAIKFVQNKLGIKQPKSSITKPQAVQKKDDKRIDKDQSKEKDKDKKKETDKQESISDHLDKTIDNDTRRIAETLFPAQTSELEGQTPQLNADQKSCVQEVLNRLDALGGTVNEACTNIDKARADRKIPQVISTSSIDKVVDEAAVEAKQEKPPIAKAQTAKRSLDDILFKHPEVNKLPPQNKPIPNTPDVSKDRRKGVAQAAM